MTAALVVDALPFARGAGRFEIPTAGDGIVTVSVTTSLERILPPMTAPPRTGRLDDRMAGYAVVELYGHRRVAFDEPAPSPRRRRRSAGCKAPTGGQESGRQ